MEGGKGLLLFISLKVL